MKFAVGSAGVSIIVAVAVNLDEGIADTYLHPRASQSRELDERMLHLVIGNTQRIQAIEIEIAAGILGRNAHSEACSVHGSPINKPAFTLDGGDAGEVHWGHTDIGATGREIEALTSPFAGCGPCGLSSRLNWPRIISIGVTFGAIVHDIEIAVSNGRHSLTRRVRG